ncbi:acyltransferase family protein [Raineyella fluvialis]|uniref:Acyltransferase family protein n=1 Tax=Raineyella fluvialis TaxID=2662261 RepID=A0A5Q2F8X0_9ACTN|nr:acyltransferase [Raineyella fluvialis]QGF23410.1 acyltransferase family protein [Raineyella fluvialis]
MTRPSASLKFPYLDGLRGIAALIVVAYHAFLFTGYQGEAAQAMSIWYHVIGYGYTGVAVFIVLSGYVLMLPIARTDDLRLRGGIWGFLKRRGRRILPPYYAALAFSLALIRVVPVMQSTRGTAWDSKLPITWDSIVAHIFLVHDSSPAWILKINGPMWSVAIEWQIYFAMALVLLPLWRRVPPGWLVGTLLLVTLTPAIYGVGASAHPWFLGLFAAGMWAAQLTLTGTSTRRYGLAALALLALTPVAASAASTLGIARDGMAETLAGLSVATGLIWIGRREISGRPTYAAKFLQSRPLVFLGLISYSLYLFHSPLLALLNLLTLPLGLPVITHYIVLTFLGIPVALAVASGMFWLVERHFLNTRQREATVELRSVSMPSEC